MAQATPPYGSSDHAADRSKSKLGDPADLADKAVQQIGKAVDTAVDKAEATVRTLSNRGNEAGEQIQQVAGNLKGAVDKSLKDQPMTTLLAAAVIGFALGALWKS